MTFGELKQKEVINIRDCKKLGHIQDLEFDECTGQIRKVIIPNKGKWFSFGPCEGDTVICYKDIRQIGPDIILIDI